MAQLLSCQLTVLKISRRYRRLTKTSLLLVQFIEGSYCTQSTRMSVPSSELAPPTPSCPPLGTNGGQQSLAGEMAGGADSDDWRESLAICRLCDSVRHEQRRYSNTYLRLTCRDQYSAKGVMFCSQAEGHLRKIYCLVVAMATVYTAPPPPHLGSRPI
jgi:hypothetical protein